jgi:hypothetical protein
MENNNKIIELYSIYLELGHEVFEEKIKKPMELYLHTNNNVIIKNSLNTIITNAMEKSKLGEVGFDEHDIFSPPSTEEKIYFDIFSLSPPLLKLKVSVRSPATGEGCRRAASPFCFLSASRFFLSSRAISPYALFALQRPADVAIATTCRRAHRRLRRLLERCRPCMKARVPATLF